jgi:hypothetical protein
MESVAWKCSLSAGCPLLTAITLRQQKMFDDVGSVNWGQLSHSHGTAEEVPSRLAALTGQSADGRRESLDYFWEYMLHQGSRYEASPCVVPFLFEVLENPGCAIQRELIDLLLALAVGFGESFLPCGYDLEEEERRFEREAWYGLFTYADARSAYFEVHKRANVFNRFLRPEHDPETRLSAGFAIAHFAQSQSAFRNEVATHIKTERDPSQLQGLMLTFAMLARYADARPDFSSLIPYLEPTCSQSLKVTSAIALTTILGSETPKSALKTLLTALTETWNVKAPRENRQWWNEGDLLGYAALVLRLAGNQHRDEVALALCTALANMEACTFAVPETLLDLLFPEPKPARGWNVADFDVVQRTSLQTLLRTEHWKDWMISSRFLPQELTGERYVGALHDFANQILGTSNVDPHSTFCEHAGNVSSWDLKKHWPSHNEW